jgi:hypothetical protein
VARRPLCSLIVIPVLCQLFLPALKGTPIGDAHARQIHEAQLNE